MRLPGGTAPILALLGQQPADPDLAVLTIIRFLHGTPADAVSTMKAARPRVAAYLAAIERFDQQVAALGPAGVSLEAAARSGPERRRFERVIRALGLELRRETGRRPAGALAGVVPDRRAEAEELRRHLAQAGIDVERFAARLNAGETIRPDIPAEMLPLPLGAPAWRHAIFRGKADNRGLAIAILRDRAASLVYFGASALDDPTRAALAADPTLLGWLTANRAATFASFARSIHVAGGRVETPGGAEFAPLWEALVGRARSSPGAFVQELLNRDEGALAWLYDTVAHLDLSRRRYALGAWMADTSARAGHLAALARVFRDAHVARTADDQPFTRLLFDPALALLVAPAGEDGRPPGASWRRLWASAFSAEGLPGPGTAPDGPGDAAAVDAAWLIERVMANTLVEARARMDEVLFSWRVFRSVPDAASPDVLVALRGFRRFPSLMLTLERAGVARPDLYAAAARTADVLTVRLPGQAALPGLVQFQSALALIDRARSRRTLDRATTDALVESLVELPLDEDGRYAGAICRWLAETFLPAAQDARLHHGDTEAPSHSGPPPADPETDVLRALAGRAEGGAAPVVAWSGRTYRVDLAGGELDRLRRVREKQDSNSLTAVLDFYRAADRLARATSAGEVRLCANALKATAAVVRPVPESRLLGQPSDPGRTVAEAAEQLAAVGWSGDRQALAGISRPLLAAADRLMADALASLVYALSSGEDDSRIALAGDAARRHDLAAGEDGSAPGTGPWRLAREVKTQGGLWGVRHSLLALETALAPHTLPRLSDTPPAHAPTMGLTDQLGVALSVAFMNPFDLTDAARDEIAAALARGRALVGRLAAGGGADAEMAEWDTLAEQAGVDEWRAQAVRRRIGVHPDRVERLLSLAELVRIGRPDPSIDIEPWGAAGFALHGCLCLKQPLVTGWESLAGRGVHSLLSTHLPDLALRVADDLAALDVPASLGPAALARVTSGFRDTAALAHHDDWLAGVAYARDLPRTHLEDLLDLLTTSRFLVPTDGQR